MSWTVYISIFLIDRVTVKDSDRHMLQLPHHESEIKSRDCAFEIGAAECLLLWILRSLMLKLHVNGVALFSGSSFASRVKCCRKMFFSDDLMTISAVLLHRFDTILFEIVSHEVQNDCKLLMKLNFLQLLRRLDVCRNSKCDCSI